LKEEYIAWCLESYPLEKEENMRAENTVKCAIKGIEVEPCSVNFCMAFT